MEKSDKVENIPSITEDYYSKFNCTRYETKQSKKFNIARNIISIKPNGQSNSVKVKSRNL